jgi:hypothetical protein
MLSIWIPLRIYNFAFNIFSLCYLLSHASHFSIIYGKYSMACPSFASVHIMANIVGDSFSQCFLPHCNYNIPIIEKYHHFVGLDSPDFYFDLDFP